MTWLNKMTLLISVFMLPGMLAGCGGDDGPKSNFLTKEQMLAQNQQQRGQAAPPPTTQPTQVKEAAPLSSGTKDSVDVWSVVSTHFLGFAEASGAFKDPFQPQLIRYAGRDELLQKIRSLQPESGQEVLVDAQVAGPKGPLQMHSLSKYTPVIILTDADQSKVVLETPDGDAHLITKGTHVGAEGGIVHDITQYAVVYSVPGRSDHVVRSIKPTLLNKLRSGSTTILGIQSGNN
jgi:hypothetical protein